MVSLVGRLRIPGVLLIGLLAVGCSSLSPHIFSERTQSRHGANAQGAGQTGGDALEEAYADASGLLRSYVTAVADQGNAPARLSAALFGLSAITIYKGLTTPNTRDLAAAGAFGSAGWAYGNTMLSPTRLGVYRAGAEALSCAILAVEPLRAVKARLGSPADSGSANTLFGYTNQVRQTRLDLQQAIDVADLLADGQEITRSVKRRKSAPPSVASEVQAPDCEALADPSPTRRQALIQQCKAQAIAKLPPKQAFVIVDEPETVLVMPPEELRAALARARAELARSDAAVQSSSTVITAMAAAGPALNHRSLTIQLAVSEQVEKTVPDPAAALRAAQGMLSVAEAIGASGLGSRKPAPPPDATAHGGGRETKKPTVRRLTREDDRAIRTLSRMTTQSVAARIPLENIVLAASGVTDKSIREGLNACSVRASGVELSVSPSGDDIPVAIGSVVSFAVKSGSDLPSAMVVIGPTAPVLPRIEGGTLKFEYRPPESAQPGDLVVIRFSDSKGLASRYVSVRIAAPVADPGAGKPAGGNAPDAAASAPDTVLPRARTARIGRTG